MSQYHTPVLLEESVDLLVVDPAGTYVDLTFGGGGHSRRILEKLGPGGRQDRDTRANCPDDGRFHYVESNFRFLRGALRLREVEQVDGILADLGVSSHHFDAVERGFSFRGEAPLDMRMNQRGALTAARVVNGYPADALTRLLGEWGELETPWKIANCIVRAREAAPIETTAQLVEAVKPCTPKKDESKFLTKLFQALRIEVNGEMEALKMALEQSLKVLRPGGRLVVISYHSLEDRLVKSWNATPGRARPSCARPQNGRTNNGGRRPPRIIQRQKQQRRMFKDHEFDPVTPEEEARRKQEEEFARRVRREVLRIERGEADEDIRADMEREEEEKAEEEERQRRERRRKASTFWQLFSGTILVHEGVSKYYPYMLSIAGMFFLSIAVMFTTLHLDMKYSRLEREVQILRERSIRLQEQRYRRTTHSAIVERLRERGIDLNDPSAPGEIIEN